MEKLIERLSNGQAAVAGCGSRCVHDYKYCDGNANCPTLDAIYEKLAQYEETGLTPDQIQKTVAEKDRPCMPNYKEALEKTNAKLAEVEHHLRNVLDERTKMGTEYEQALIRIDELNGKIEFLKGQVDAYQYCMNCRR